MHTYMETGRRASPFWSLCAMRDELVRSLSEALFELDALPCDDDAAVVALYAVMDDVERAIRRTQALDATSRRTLSGTQPAGARAGSSLNRR